MTGVSTDRNIEEDHEYSPEGASLISDRPRTTTRILRKRGIDPIIRAPGVITLKASPKGMAGVLRKIQKKALTLMRRQVPSTNKCKFTFGVSQIEYHYRPRQSDIDHVARILEEERPTLLAQVSQDNATTPMHSEKSFTFDAIVRVILSQVSTNEGALDVQQCMIHAYPYMVNGKKVVGTVPNYHLMRIQSNEKLQKVLKKAGLYDKKAKAIKICLDKIYNHNVSLLGPGEVAYRHNATNAPDFVPGLLSVDYLRSLYAVSGKQGVFDHLVSFDLIGTKTAACVMAFGMKIPVFAVDTHVAGMAKLLGWVPQDVTEDEMCSHLDTKIVDDGQGKKLNLHQDFWRHRRTCAKCSGRSLPGSWAFENTVCPLEHLITRPTPRKVILKPSSKGEPRPRVMKPIDEDALRARGLIKVTYPVDDDFDAANGVFTMRTAWVEDFSMLEAEVPMVPVEEESVEEMEICSDSMRRKLELRNDLI